MDRTATMRVLPPRPVYLRCWGGRSTNASGVVRQPVAAIAERERDIDTIYRASSLDEVQHLLDRYNVEYIVYGYLEANKYQDYGAAARAKFDTGLETIFRAGNTAVYKVEAGSPLKSGAPAQLPRGGAIGMNGRLPLHDPLL